MKPGWLIDALWPLLPRCLTHCSVMSVALTQWEAHGSELTLLHLLNLVRESMKKE